MEKLEKDVGDLWEKNANSNYNLIAEMKKKLEQLESEVRGEESVDQYLAQTHSKLVSSELSLLDQVITRRFLIFCLLS